MNRPPRHAVLQSLAWLAVVALTACGSAPLSFVKGIPETGTDMDLYPVRVVSVDGSIQFGGAGKPLQVSPGARSMVFEAAPGRGARRSVQKTFVFKVQPCTRYFLAARRSSPMDSDWSLVVHSTERVSGCDEAEELRKAALSERPASPASSPA